jgi:hypothetical protein
MQSMGVEVDFREFRLESNLSESKDTTTITLIEKISSAVRIPFLGRPTRGDIVDEFFWSFFLFWVMVYNP